MKKAFFRTMVCAGVAGMFLNSRTNEDLYDPNAVIKQYEQNWEKTFGKIDPNQTWNTAKQAVANISIGYKGDYVAKIYTANPRENDAETYLLGKFEVEGGTTSSLKFDMPSTLQYVYVALVDKDGGKIIKSAHLANGMTSVAFGNNAASRTVNGSDGGTFKIEDNGYEEYETSLVSADGGFLSKIPERKNNLVTKGEQYQNFLYKANEPFIVQPIYMITSATLSLGIYWYDANGDKQEQVIWGYHKDAFQAFQKAVYDWDTDKWVSPNWSGDEAFWTGKLKYKSESIKVTPPAGGITFGFFIINAGFKYYTEAELNKNIPGSYQSPQRATTFDIGNKRYLGFEDGIDFDMNDIVLHFPELSTPDIIDKEPDPTPDTAPSWILACEDLGSIDDFDFNDVVFSVSHVSGETTATVTPLAAGGTLSANILHNGKNLGEIHQLLGSSEISIMNTTSRGTAGTPQTIEAPADFSMASNMGSFSVKISGTWKGEDIDKTVNISAPGQGEAPQMICVDNSGNWAWPTERTRIDDAYSGFGEWGSNYGTSTDWYKKATGSVVK